MFRCLAFVLAHQLVADRLRRDRRYESVLFLFFQHFELAPLAIQLGLIGIDLALLVGLLLFLSLQLIADQCAGAQDQEYHRQLRQCPALPRRRQ